MSEAPAAPDLQEWIDRYGGYDKIDWEAWDAAMAEWAAQRRLFYSRLYGQTFHTFNRNGEKT